MDYVTMTHPDLRGQEITVPASAVRHHRASGWEVKPPETARAAKKKVAEDDGEKTE